MTKKEDLFHYFPEFKHDFHALFTNRIIILNSNGLLWNASKTSLGQYFHNFKKIHNRKIKGGFWRPIEEAFNIKRGTLKSLVSRNGRDIVIVKDSKDYEDIKFILEKHRKNTGEQKRNLIKFTVIKKIIENTDINNYYEVLFSLEKIKFVY